MKVEIGTVRIIGSVLWFFVIIILCVFFYEVWRDLQDMKREHKPAQQTTTQESSDATLILSADIEEVEDTWAIIKTSGKVSEPQNTTMHTKHKPTVSRTNGEYVITFGAKEE